ncbi:hypothetical protein ABES02_29840 [Neobacillus pocheonensis]|uniref:hypothetical protein n=1 Tax=Neobacillus pocheonensis TaxID=363869 RepID=UPI003D273668
MMESLLTFNKPFQESCDICQGDLYYFTDLSTYKIIKECHTCTSWFEGNTGMRLKVNIDAKLRPATRTEIIKAGISLD